MILALETSSVESSIALLESPTKVVDTVVFSKGREYAEPTVENLVQILKVNSLTLEQIDRLAIGLGPGRFTGVRVGVGITRALAFAANKTVVGINSLRVLAAAADSNDDVWCLVNAHKNTVFASCYRGSQVKLGPTVWPIRAIDKNVPRGSIVVGDALSVYENALDSSWTKTLNANPKILVPRAADLGRLAFGEGQVFHPDQWKNIIPLYVRDSEAEENLKRGLLKPLLKL